MRRSWLSVVILAFALSVPPASLRAQAGGPCQGLTAELFVLDKETITVSTSPIGFTAAKVQQTAGSAAYASFTVRTGAISFTLAGDTPSSAVGFPVLPGDGRNLCGLDSLKGFRAIRTGSVDATVYVTYWKAK